MLNLSEGVLMYLMMISEAVCGLLSGAPNQLLTPIQINGAVKMLGTPQYNQLQPPNYSLQ